MNRRLIIRVLGAILLVEAAAMIPALLVSLVYNDGDTAVLGLSILIVSFIGTLMMMLPPPLPGSHLRLKEGFIITALGWILMSLCGALPFFISGIYPRFEDAFFEAVSGFTTTGASVLTRFEGFPHGIMLWRATTHWVGGMGVLVLTLALLPKLTGRTAHLVKAESPGPSLSKLVPQTGKTAKILYSLYIGLTLLEFVSLLLCGVTPYDAVIHTFGTATLLPAIAEALKAKNVEIRGDQAASRIIECIPATEKDWSTEYLDYIISVRVVSSLREAVDHINHYGSHHTDCIVTEDKSAAAEFMNRVDSAGVYWNVSTRFADGFVYGFGAEVGIATGKIHARGPMGLEGLTTYKYKLIGNGNILAEMKDGTRSFTHVPLDENCPL